MADDEKKRFENLSPEQKARMREVYKSVTESMKKLDLPPFTMPKIDLPQFHSPALEQVAKSIAQSQRFTFDIDKSLQVNLPNFKLDLPPLRLDYEHLFGPAFNVENLGIKQILDTASENIFQSIYESQRERFELIFENVRKIADSLLLPNWKDLDSLDKFETLLLDEGLAVAWVPPGDILAALVAAPTKQARRQIVGRRWKRIVAACREILETCSDADYLGYREFALEVAAALESGHSSGAQALAANLLDTMLRKTLDGPARRLVTDQTSRLSIDDLPFRAAMVFGGIWGSHTTFWQSRGDSIPRHFTRHASAHAVSKRQYSRLNAVIALMHVTAYIKLLDSGELR